MFHFKKHTWAALKILRAKFSDLATNEIAMLQPCAEGNAQDDPGADLVTALLDNFEHIGPNEKHRCLIFEAMGPDMSSMIDTIIEDLQRKRVAEAEKQGRSLSRGRPKCPPPLAKKMLRSALGALDFLHRKGIVHGDIQHGNFLFCCPSIKHRHRRRIASRPDP